MSTLTKKTEALAVDVSCSKDALIGGIAVHWKAIDEDISVASLLQPDNFVRLPGRVLPAMSRAGRSTGYRRRHTGRG